ncbi:signal peptidase I [Flavicella sp.]|uniref:signal peptidase I n=1 Tax=Flavicella sp. TaxID=2957742 RepID=UPI002620219A|nr:signal peptidase I [Flavicella sp.]MDG1803832.1 signal peptidase I [Flavicella sp.]
MTFTAWLVVILVIQGIHFLGTWKLYQKAGRKPWEAIVPIYNGIVLMQIINRPKWWVILLFIPVINLIMFPVVWVETSRSFGKNSTIDTVLSIFSLGFYAYYLNYAADVTYIEDRSLTPKTEVGEWTSSILFAIVAATLVHTYVMQPYTIPTSSLEKSLLVGDFLFVSKFHYGAKTPTSLIAAPMVHDTLPFVKKKSYVYNDDPNDKNSFLNKFQLPYFRLPGFQDIKRNEIVVFNWPADTVRQFFTQDRKFAKPIDKKSNYVKRCVGIAGDSLEIRDGHIFINGERSILPERAKPQFYYTVDTDGKNMSDNMIYNTYHVRPGEARTTYKEYVLPLAYEKQLYNKFGKDYLQNRKYLLNLDEKNASKLKKNKQIKSVSRNIQPKGEAEGVFPSMQMNWNKDNMGPIYIPEEGKTVSLDIQSLPFYKKIITEYEHNTLAVEGNSIFINGQKVTSYTFKQNYYWMMGDNRHNSEDSRYWGYVPFDHVVGKPVFVWFSWDTYGKGLDKIRWERLFTTVHGEGPLKSYFYYFLGLLVLYIGYGQYKKRKS